MDFDDLEEAEEAAGVVVPEAPGEFSGGILTLCPHNIQFPDPYNLPQDLTRKCGLPPSAKHREPKIRLFVFYGAGDSLIFWAQWMHQLPDWIEAAVYEWPSHGVREDEDHLKDAGLVIDDAMSGLAEAFRQHAKGGILEGAPFALMGHSTGVVLICGVAERARRLYGLEPAAMFFLDRGALQYGLCSDYGKKLQEEDISAWLRIFHTSMARLLDQRGDKDPKARKSFQMWCDDIQMQEWTQPLGWHIFRCPLHSFVAMQNWALDPPHVRASMSEQDRLVVESRAAILGSEPGSCALFTRRAYEDWQRWTTESCTHYEVDCDHTTIKDNPFVRSKILEVLAALVKLTAQ
mmetsp:Transcript_41755/g.75807  ORF Transcript_41755/g.75807 Transcript_41755/m.75807 type:complete len:348 (+) Transcript_41755:64-1107(+)